MHPAPVRRSGLAGEFETEIEIARRVEYVSLEDARKILALAEPVDDLVDQLLRSAHGKGPGTDTSQKAAPFEQSMPAWHGRPARIGPAAQTCAP